MEFEAYRLYVLSTLKGLDDTHDLEFKLKQIWDITQKHSNNGFCDIKHAVNEVCTTFNLDIPSFSSNISTSLDLVQQKLPSEAATEATTETTTSEATTSDTAPLETAPLETAPLEAIATDVVEKRKSSVDNLVEQYIKSGKTESEIKGFMDAIKLLKIDCQEPSDSST